ncbi:MAG: hypothetical protein LBL20_01520 [Treponema sp.]|jgi:hypothetical protein|nr:hypothetical protein [Treponema sp.]
MSRKFLPYKELAIFSRSLVQNQPGFGTSSSIRSKEEKTVTRQAPNFWINFYPEKGCLAPFCGPAGMPAAVIHEFLPAKTQSCKTAGMPFYSSARD